MWHSGFHNRWNSAVGVRHPNLWVFLWKRRNGSSVEHYTRPKMGRIHHNENANTVCYRGGLSDWIETTNEIVGLCLHFGRPCRTPYISIEIEFNNVERLYFWNNKTSTSSARRSVNDMAWDILWINCRSRPNDYLREQQCRPGVF